MSGTANAALHSMLENITNPENNVVGAFINLSWAMLNMGEDRESLNYLLDLAIRSFAEHVEDSE